jgi:uncharacterized glyoxalase superfamily protein PhnB
MSLTKLTPNIIVSDVNATVDYYRDTLGFNLIASVPETGTFNWAMVGNDGVTIMFQTPGSVESEIPSLKGSLTGNATTLYIDTDNVRALHAALREKTNVIMDLTTTFYGATEFAIRDPNGFVLTFAQHESA